MRLCYTEGNVLNAVEVSSISLQLDGSVLIVKADSYEFKVAAHCLSKLEGQITEGAVINLVGMIKQEIPATSEALSGNILEDVDEYERASAWFKRLSYEDCKKLVEMDHYLFNALYVGGGLLRSIPENRVRSVVNSIPVTSKPGDEPGWIFVKELDDYYHGVDTILAPGYTTFWELLRAKDYAALFDIGPLIRCAIGGTDGLEIEE